MNRVCGLLNLVKTKQKQYVMKNNRSELILSFPNLFLDDPFKSILEGYDFPHKGNEGECLAEILSCAHI